MTKESKLELSLSAPFKGASGKVSKREKDKARKTTWPTLVRPYTWEVVGPGLR